MSRTGWFVAARFGLFIHWGLYALPARHEWVQSREEISSADYRRYFDRWEPDLFAPAEWARRARLAGAKYVVITTKHHEGFCLWDTAETEFKVTNTPIGRDLLGELVNALREEGLRVGFYYSLLDWNQPIFSPDIFHPDRHRASERTRRGRDTTAYAAFMRRQVTELLTGYGPIDVMWFDFSYPNRPYGRNPGKGRTYWESDELVALVRRLQPETLVNDRLDLPIDLIDFQTIEQAVIDPRADHPSVWEACHTLGGSWGYFRDESSQKSPEQLIGLLVDCVSKGGNLLFNVGPTARGVLDRRTADALDVFARWTELHGRAVFGAGPSSYESPGGCRLTQRNNRLYLHILEWPVERVAIRGLAGRLEYAQLLNDASEVPFVVGSGERENSGMWPQLPLDTITFRLPIRKPDTPIPVVEIFLKETTMGAS